MVTALYRNIAFSHVYVVLGYGAKLAEDHTFNADRTSHQAIVTVHGGPHVLVPFAVEDEGRLGAHALALLKAFATAALEMK